jgi:glycosyltransferase involved in cell wall biosynthesis
MPSPARPLRLLTVTHNYPRFSGDPAGAFVARVAQGAAAHGHQVQVVAPHAPGNPATEDIAGVRVRRFRYGPDALERVAYTGNLHGKTLGSPLSALGVLGFLVAFRTAVRKAIKELSPDVVHAHWWVPSGWLVSRSRVPYVVTCHGSDIRLLERSSVVRALALPVFDRAARVTTVSNFLARDLGRLLPSFAADVQVTSMPVDTDIFSSGSRLPKHQPARILYAGNLVASKGVDVLIRAVAELAHRGVPCELKILGEGPLQSELLSLAASLGIAGKVTWSPFVPQSQMPAEYGVSTVTVLPSRGRAEGLGLTLVEALLSGSAVVGTPAGGIPEVVVHERTGLIARDGDPVDLADQIQRLLTDEELRSRLVHEGVAHALRTYSPDAAIARFLEIYDAVADHQPVR